MNDIQRNLDPRVSSSRHSRDFDPFDSVRRRTHLLLISARGRTLPLIDNKNEEGEGMIRGSSMKKRKGGRNPHRALARQIPLPLPPPSLSLSLSLLRESRRRRCSFAAAFHSRIEGEPSARETLIVSRCLFVAAAGDAR